MVSMAMIPMDIDSGAVEHGDDVCAKPSPATPPTPSSMATNSVAATAATTDVNLNIDWVEIDLLDADGMPATQLIPFCVAVQVPKTPPEPKTPPGTPPGTPPVSPAAPGTPAGPPPSSPGESVIVEPGATPDADPDDEYTPTEIADLDTDADMVVEAGSPCTPPTSPPPPSVQTWTSGLLNESDFEDDWWKYPWVGFDTNADTPEGVSTPRTPASDDSVPSPDLHTMSDTNSPQLLPMTVPDCPDSIPAPGLVAVAAVPAAESPATVAAATGSRRGARSRSPRATTWTPSPVTPYEIRKDSLEPN